jgi:hypothetical protein
VWGWTRVAFLDAPAGADRVPGAVPESGFVGAGWKGGGLSFDVGFRRTGKRPLDRAGSMTADRQDTLEVKVQQEWRTWTVALAVDNAFSRKSYNQEYLYRSRLPDEPAGGVRDRNFKPADSQHVRVEIRKRF